jgi:hypothetical protein
LLRKKAIAEGSVSHTPFHESLSFSGELVTFQNLDFDTLSEQSLVRKRSDIFVTEIILDPTILQPQTPKVLSPTTKTQTTHSVLASPSSSSFLVATLPII